MSSGRPTHERNHRTAYTTPALLKYGNTVEIVITGGDAVTGHDPATGKELWRVRGLNPDRRRRLSHRRVAGGGGEDW